MGTDLDMLKRWGAQAMVTLVQDKGPNLQRVFVLGGGKWKQTWVDVTEGVEVLWAPMPGIG